MIKNLGLFLSLYILSVPALSKQAAQPTKEQQKQEEASENLIQSGVPPHNLGTGTGYGYYPVKEKDLDKKERKERKKIK
jgi:hypothetical protein